MTKLLLTPIEAAEQLSLSRSKVYELLCSGELESVSIGRSRRIPVDAIHDYVNRLREQVRQEQDEFLARFGLK